MPRNVRNFWIEIEIDGRKTRFGGGPSSPDGGFTLTVKQRNHGRVTDALHVVGTADDDGTLQTEARLDVAYWWSEDALIAASKR